MKKSTTGISIGIIILVIAMVGGYAYLSNRRREMKQSETGMGLVQSTLSRNLSSDYPATPKEVMKYYNDFMRCFYDTDCSDEELRELGLKVRELYDSELLEINDEDTYMQRLMEDIKAFRDKKRKITSFTVPASTNVNTYTADGYSFAKLTCSYNIVENGMSTLIKTVYLLRRDEDKHWKIYGWQPESD